MKAGPPCLSTSAGNASILMPEALTEDGWLNGVQTYVAKDARKSSSA